MGSKLFNLKPSKVRGNKSLKRETRIGWSVVPTVQAHRKGRAIFVCCIVLFRKNLKYEISPELFFFFFLTGIDLKVVLSIGFDQVL